MPNVTLIRREHGVSVILFAFLESDDDTRREECFLFDTVRHDPNSTRKELQLEVVEHIEDRVEEWKDLLPTLDIRFSKTSLELSEKEVSGIRKIGDPLIDAPASTVASK